ncbi:hypothetical protein [uncultured Intestinimonas sp.]|uniref:hypothetical protein n=1 Tax=uncultured Intestinimonas sp. TaxID=1689265 RepID=UPI0025F847DD|nr:hypothetical protein [uncultured Intestinimonas sp.]
MSYLLRQLFNSFGIFFRTIRAFFTRKLVGIGAYFRRITNFSRHATKVASASFQGAAAAVKKPTRREDYIETRRLFISKSFLILLAVGLVLAALLLYFVVWPFLLSRFFTARFYQGDADLQTWSGRVIVYYDEAKEQPMYSGTLQDGLLQGRGREYDEAGLVTYEGSFVDGQRSGTGSLYENGVLVYEGDFANGAATGMGIAYADGVKRYEGAFVDGVYEGEGAEYDADGNLKYKGSFAAGVYEGQGTAYYPSGERAYVGAFAGGLYEGEGTEYTEDGQVRYKGAFAAGLYEGTGVLYREDGDQIRAEFSAGTTTGTIQWYQNGALWYDGAADGVIPDGFGTIYGEDGKVIYAGELDQGTLDGAWLLTLTAEELRTAFGEASLTETDAPGGFLVANQALGVTALCSYRQGEEEAQVYQVWLAPEADSLPAELLPWEDAAEAEDWALMGRDSQTESQVVQGPAYGPDGTADGDWWQRQYRYADYRCTLLCETEEGAPLRITWSRDLTLSGEEGTADTGTTEVQERLDALLTALDGAGGTISDESSGSGSSDLGSVERMVALMLTPEDAESLVGALTDYYIYGEMAAALEASQPLLEQLLAEAQTQLARGSGTQEAVDGAQADLDDLSRQITQYKTAQEQAGLTIQSLSKLSPDDYDLQQVLLTFDPVEMDVASLYSGAQSYAAAAGQDDVDSEALERELRSAVLDLSMSYESVRAAREGVERSAAAVEEQTQAYARGTAERADLYAAQCAQNQAAAALYQAVGTFTQQASALNTLSGGWIAQEYGWMADTFATLFQSQIVQGETAAQEAEDQREQQEEEAAQAIQEEQAAATAAPEETPAPEEEAAETAGESPAPQATDAP